MFKCIICFNDLDDSRNSDEHIFPEAIGGTIIINNVCKDCNDHLGSYVDSHLVNHFFIQSQRLFLKLSGKTGKIPNPLENGTMVSDPTQKIKYFIKDGIPESLYLLPNIKYDTDENGNITLNIRLDEKDENKIDDIISKLKERAAKKGQKLNFKMNKVVKGTLKTPAISTKVKYDLINWHRSLIKIAYELVAKYCDDSFLNTGLASSFRNLLTLKTITEKDLVNTNFKGKIEFIDKAKGDFSIFDDSNSLYGILYHLNSNLLCEVRIFEIFRCLLTMIENYEGPINSKDALIFKIDVRNKTFEELTLVEYLQKYFPSSV